MSNRSMDLRVTILVADAQNFERLGDNDYLGCRDALAAGRYDEAAECLRLALCHMKDRANAPGSTSPRNYTRREAQRHIGRLIAKANRLRRQERAANA
jgi:hypothetical protein